MQSPTKGNAFMDEDSDIEEDASERGEVAREKSKYALEVAKKENRWVLWLRVLTALVLLSVAITVCLVVFFTESEDEKHNFEHEFSEAAEKLVTDFDAIVKQRFRIITSFAQDLSANSVGEWPFVVPPFFYERAELVSIMSSLMYLLLIPKVTAQEADAWNEFAWTNQGWKAEGLSKQTGVALEKVNAAPVLPQMMNMHNPNGPTPATKINPEGPYWPTWCTYPIMNSTGEGVDIYGDIEHRESIDLVVASRNPVLEPSYDYMGGNEKDTRYDFIKEAKHIAYLDDPYATAFVPVFDGLGRESEIKAVLFIFIYWRTYFDYVLPQESDGLVIILENTCNQTYTYEVDGIHSTFIGHGDLHDHKYDHLGIGTGVDVRTTDNLDNAEQGCLYSIRVYPSQRFENDHLTNKPGIYSAILAALFIFTSAVFLFYDFMVERRQRIVFKSAQQSGLLVSSLFPEKVREQLYAEQQDQSEGRKGTEWERKSDERRNANVPAVFQSKKAIANLYPETTIYFADLVGFTSWCSKRNPPEIFSLLETLYGAFDALAARRNVFKVETIGDCYVAACGLPEPQPDHAVVMCKFATDCSAKFKILTAVLSETLGQDTADLAMRIGLHSGSVTAGVLRGERARFQLFGDTVNTASRMESNGVPNKIHVSQQTADALIARGKSHWLTPREGKILAKGKGELQTYFVTVTSKDNSKPSVVSSTGYQTSQSFNFSFHNEDESLKQIDAESEENASIVST